MTKKLIDEVNDVIGSGEHIFLGASWEDPGIRRNIRRIPSEFGEVVAYENFNMKGTRVPGFYVRNLTKEEYPPGDGILVRAVPKKLREDIKNILISHGYKEPIDFEK